MTSSGASSAGSSGTRTALVVGGGIGGPVAAMALQQAGIEAAVYEAYAGPADEAGGALSLAPNGLDALDAIGVGDAVRTVGHPMAGIALHSWNGKRLAELTAPAGLQPQRLVMRGDLHGALRDEAARRGIRTEYAKRLVGAEQDAEGVTAHFADGSRVRADVLVGADGIRSTVRRLIDPAAPGPRYAGLQGFGATVRDSGLPPTGGMMHMTFGKRAFFGLQVLDDGTAVWFVNLPHREALTTAEARAVGAEAWLARLREACAADRTPAVRLIDGTPPEALIIAGPSEAMRTAPVWSRGRLVLIGDAAHAASSSSGQGASLACESAVQLARCLRDLPREQAFPAYEALRRTRVERIIAAAARTNSGKAAGPVGRVLRDALMPPAMRLLRVDRKAAEPFHHHIDWAEPVRGTAPGRAPQAAPAGAPGTAPAGR